MVVGRCISKFIGLSCSLYADQTTLDRWISETRHKYQSNLQLVRVRIAAIYWLEESGWVESPVRHEHLGSVVDGIILEIDNGVTAFKSKIAVFKSQQVIGGTALRTQHQVLIKAVWPEVHDAVVNHRNGRVLNKDAEPLGNGIGQWLLGDLARERAGHASKQS